jgi:hypothetical protein
MRQGLEAYFALRSDTHTAVVQLDREAPVRQRLITVANERQATLALDFTCEPGTITSGAITYSGDESWREKPSPLTQQLHHFFACIARGQTTKADREALSCSVNFSHAAAQRLSCPPSSAA